MKFFQTILTEMFLGNFSFAILIVGIVQIVLMAINLYYTKKSIKQTKVSTSILFNETKTTDLNYSSTSDEKELT